MNREDIRSLGTGERRKGEEGEDGDRKGACAAAPLCVLCRSSQAMCGPGWRAEGAGYHRGGKRKGRTRETMRTLEQLLSQGVDQAAPPLGRSSSTHSTKSWGVRAVDHQRKEEFSTCLPIFM